jgi:outer membrane receptor protein involved in Fe transport
MGSRFVTRTNLFYKTLQNFGDSGVVGNSTLYNRLSVDKQEAYGIETRMDLKPGKNGAGFYGFVSNTLAVAYLRGTKQITGGIYEIENEPVLEKYPDHDRRISLVAALGYKTERNFWVLADMQFMTGLQNLTPVSEYYAYPLRLQNTAIFNLSAGCRIPQKIKKKFALTPDAFDIRIQNLLNTRAAVNAGSPFQGTRFILPFRFLIGCNWNLGKEPIQIANSKSTEKI